MFLESLQDAAGIEAMQVVAPAAAWTLSEITQLCQTTLLLAAAVLSFCALRHSHLQEDRAQKRHEQDAKEQAKRFEAEMRERRDALKLEMKRRRLDRLVTNYAAWDEAASAYVVSRGTFLIASFYTTLTPSWLAQVGESPPEYWTSRRDTLKQQESLRDQFLRLPRLLCGLTRIWTGDAGCVTDREPAASGI